MPTDGALRSNAVQSARDADRRIEDLGPRFGAEVLGPGLWVWVWVWVWVWAWVRIRVRVGWSWPAFWFCRTLS